MRIKIDGGFVSAKREKSGKISFAVGCEHYNPDGTRKETVVNTAELSEEELIKLFSDVFEESKDVEDGYSDS